MHSRADGKHIGQNHVAECKTRCGVARSERFQTLKFVNRVERDFRKRNNAFGLNHRNHHIIVDFFVCDSGYVADESIKIFSFKRQSRRHLMTAEFFEMFGSLRQQLKHTYVFYASCGAFCPVPVKADQYARQMIFFNYFGSNNSDNAVMPIFGADNDYPVFGISVFKHFFNVVDYIRFHLAARSVLLAKPLRKYGGIFGIFAKQKFDRLFGVAYPACGIYARRDLKRYRRSGYLSVLISARSLQQSADTARRTFAQKFQPERHKHAVFVNQRHYIRYRAYCNKISVKRKRL